MNKSVMFSLMSIVALIATSAYAPVTAASLSEKSSQFAPEVQRGILADSDDGDDSDGPDGPDDPDGPGDPDAPPNSIPEGPIPPDDKPDIANPEDLSDQPLSTVIGFTFPSGIKGGWTIPLVTAALEEISIDSSESFTQVGIVVVDVNGGSDDGDSDNGDSDNDDSVIDVNGDSDNGDSDNGDSDNDDSDDGDSDDGDSDDDDSDSHQPEFRTYTVEIDVTSTADIVPGRLVSTATEEIIDVNFERIPQIVNPQREEAIYPEFQLDFAPTSTATIASDRVCFVVNTAEDGFIRYCSTATSQSVRDSFPTQYKALQNMIIAAAAHIGLEAPLALDQTLSTIEDAQRIQDCANASDELAKQTACTSDIIVAPVTREFFDRKYDQKFGEGDGDNGGDDGESESQTVSRDTVNFAADDDGDNDSDDSNQLPKRILIAAVKVLQPIEFPTADSSVTEIVQPGDYRLHAWFDVNGVFFAATLSGLTTDNTRVINQQIPAIPELFIDVGGNSPDAEINGFCIFGWCCGSGRGK